MNSPKLSLYAAMLVNINIMLGSGIFINTVLLSQAAGGFGAAVYLLVGLLVFPLILVMAELLKYHHGGTFYEFGNTLHPLVGFISSWSYFTAKLASCALGVHIFVTLMQKLCTSIAPYNPLVLDTIILLLFMFLNFCNVRIGRTIQYGFIALKLIPILFVIVAALLFFDGAFYTTVDIPWQGIVGSIPFVLFAFSGFEASCSLSRTIENPEKNGPRAILLSYLIVLGLLCAYQIGFYGLFGQQLAACASFRDAFPALAAFLFDTVLLRNISTVLMLAGIAASSLGASYGIMYSNVWNLYTLALHRKVIGSAWLLKLNNQQIPILCVIIEGILALMYTWFAAGNQIPLQQTSALGSTIAYSISVIAFLAIAYKSASKRTLALCGLASCLILFAATFANAFRYGFAAYSMFASLLALGLILYALAQFKRH